MKKDELQNFDGKDGRKAYVSHDGKVYDVTESRLWKNGKHVNRHFAGMDLTEALESAPHGPEVLERFAMVADLDDPAEKPAEEKNLKSLIRKLYKVFHPHPMVIHFPMGLITFALIMQIIFLATGRLSFETSAYYALCASTVFLVPTIVSGFVSWWVNYDNAMNRLFRMKITFSAILLVMCISEVILRTMHPELAFAQSGRGIMYNAMLFINVPVLGVIGYNGGKLTWG